MAKQMLVIKVNGTISVKPYNDGIEEIQAVVGGYVEVVMLNDSTSLWVHEEGKCIGLHPNLFATRLWEKFHGRTDIVVGDVAILGGTDEDGNSMGCPKNVIDEVRSWASAMEPTVRIYGW